MGLYDVIIDRDFRHVALGTGVLLWTCPMRLAFLAYLGIESIRDAGVFACHLFSVIYITVHMIPGLLYGRLKFRILDLLPLILREIMVVMTEMSNM
jgi:hypothetical protein